MSIYAIIGFIAAVAVVALGLKSVETTKTVYAQVGATAGIFFTGANRWAREGLLAIVTR